MARHLHQMVWKIIRSALAKNRSTVDLRRRSFALTAFFKNNKVLRTKLISRTEIERYKKETV
jgi:hypothetical protein